MKHTRLVLAFAFTTMLSTSALAASVTMLQFGSFESRAEAQKRLNEVTAKHSAFLGKLATNVREVKLPPDNLTVYRTQAGPLESRSAAQSICSQLASAGDECYIVQTAMVSAPTTSIADAKAAVEAPVAKAVSDVKTEIASAVDAVTPEVPDVTSKLSSPSLTSGTRDPLSRAALDNVGSTLAAASVADKVIDTSDAEASAVNKALDSAISKKPETDANLSSIAKASSSPRHGFWSRINPFSDNEPVKAPAVKAPEVTSAPVEEVSVADVPSVLPETPKLPAISTPEVDVKAPELKAPEVKVEAPKLASAAPAVVNLSRAPIKLDSTPVITVAEPMRLPPPPAPLKAQDREALAAGIKPTISAPEAIAVGPITTPAVNGSVQVEEAKRVPVTQTLVPPTAPAVSPVVRTQPSAALSPSATDGQKTIWAQVGPFVSEQAALAYWTNYRQSHPDFPVVRVRATTPLQESSKPQSWLRVGPVANAGFVANLCASFSAQSGLRCGAVRDSGAASPLSPATKQSSTSRYKR